MRVKKRLSKRVNTRQRNRIQKKISEHHRKARKSAKQNTQWKSRKPRDIGVPNSFPFKEEVLAEVEETRRKREEEKALKRKVDSNGVENGVEANGVGEEERAGKGGEGFAAGIQIDDDDEDILDGESDSEDEDEESMSEEDADDDDMEDEEDDEDEDDENGGDAIESSESEWQGIESDDGQEIADLDSLTEYNTMRNSSWSSPLYMKAIRPSNLIVFVLDARGITLTRSFETEDYAKKKGKESIFVLNRAEQLPAEKLKELIDGYAPNYRMFPLITDSPSPFAHTTTPTESIDKIKSVVNETEGKVAIVGGPMVGKSLLFANLLGISPSRKATESLRSRELTSTTTLIDTPALTITSLHPLHALLGYIPPTFATIEDLVIMLDECPPEYWAQLEQLYGIPALVRPIRKNRFVHPAKDLCVHVARKFGRLGKGGPNIQAAVDIITEDCLKGKLKWFLD